MNINSFLQIHSTENKDNATHFSLVGGKYNIPRDKYNELLNYILKSEIL